MGIEVQHLKVFNERLFAPAYAKWHCYRIPVLILAVAIFLGARLTLHKWKQRPKTAGSTTPPPESPVSGDKKLVWRDQHGKIGTEQETPSPNLFQDKSPNDRTKLKTAERRIASSTTRKYKSGSEDVLEDTAVRTGALVNIQPLVFFSSLTGTTEKFARTFTEELRVRSEKHGSGLLSPELHDISYIDHDDYFTAPPSRESTSSNVQFFYIILIPTYNVDTIINTFLDHLQETHHDFRIDTAPLSRLAGYSVFGFGDKEGWKTEDEGFCSQAVAVDKWLAKLTGRKRAFPLGTGDIKSDASIRLNEWREGITNVLVELVTRGSLGEGVLGSGNPVESDEEESGDDSRLQNRKKSRKVIGRRAKGEVSVGDLEDLGGKPDITSNKGVKSQGLPRSIPIDFTTVGKAVPVSSESQEMVPVTSPTYAALTKQGYTIIGSHSGVKICRWTKSALRGRGSCYKYSFYGIKSHLCMETTPSLSCSNKCVFCWRHGTNPIGTTWRWKVDPPDMIFLAAKEAHLKKIKMMRGVPGVRAERFQEAMKIRHCALSLVGEPIFYPHINDFLRLLHQDKISSFLVCNAQHPEQLEALQVVTQLYVSIDASNRESLRKVDRPLHRDFWERFLKCLDIIREKRFRMRTVYRLTLVKGFNIEDEAEGYADLVARGLPCFVEVKGVTYCGTSSSASAGLTMQNVPFYEEVVAFVEALNEALGRRGLDYGIAAEHAHSCCILLASSRFFIDGKWHTIIDYARFFECLESGKDFAPEDYVGPPTPEWATWGNGGFDPADERVDRKGRPKINECTNAVTNNVAT